MSNHVIILGGGVAGMSAAHELIERGFRVTVYEHKPVPGGKARSMPVPGSGTDGRKDLPGEHGFRFFPRFYKHLPDTLSRIPYGNGTVLDNLVQTTRIEMAQYGAAPLITISRFPRSWADLKCAWNSAFNNNTGLTKKETWFFTKKLLKILTSCQDRRIAEYEKINWWKFIDADNQSKAYQKFFGHGITRSLVAAKAHKASARTMGDITTQMMLDIMRPGTSADRLLNGPTDDVWIMPWLKYLQGKGVEYITTAQVKGINCDGTKITGAVIEKDGVTFTVTGDHYLCAMPIERIAPLITPEILEADPSLVGLPTLAKNVEWMNGIQYYLKQDVPLDHGHTIFIDSQWALTSVSQRQFWTGVNLSDYGDGNVHGILSVDISEWDKPGVNHKRADKCTREEVAQDTWEQLKASLNVDGQQILTDDNKVRWFLDPDIRAEDDQKGPITRNREPLLVNLIDTWDMRPEASTQIPNLFLASDYVQTYTDLATMEGANEAARRAVNGIIGASGLNCKPCGVWPMREPWFLAPWKWADQRRFNKGLPWNGSLFG